MDRGMDIVVTGPSDWKASPLKEIDRLLRCPICFEFFEAPVILPCSHTFCSLCIRRHLQYKTTCPACMQEASATRLVSNLIVGLICTQFTQHRATLLKLCCKEFSYDKLGTTHQSKEIVPVAPKDFALNSENVEEELESVELGFQNGCVKQEPKLEDDSLDLTPLLGQSPAHLFTTDDRSCCFGDLQRLHDVSYDVSKNDLVSQSNSSTDDIKPLKTVSEATNTDTDDSTECPVCGIHVLTEHMNNHLDICLKYSAARHHNTSISKSPFVLPKLPKLCYTIMKESQLRQKLKEYHLPSVGPRASLISRLKEFTLHYNAQCDSPQPKTIKEIALEVEMIEKEKNTPRRKQTFGLHLSKNSTMEEIERRCHQYAAQNTDQFENLISGVRKRLLSSETSDNGSSSDNRNHKAHASKRRCRDVSGNPDLKL